MFADVMPPPLPTAYAGDNGASRVIIQAIAPGAISSGEVAILAVCMFGFSFVVILLLFLLLRRAI